MPCLMVIQGAAAWGRSGMRQQKAGSGERINHMLAQKCRRDEVKPQLLHGALRLLIETAVPSDCCSTAELLPQPLPLPPSWRSSSCCRRRCCSSAAARAGSKGLSPCSRSSRSHTLACAGVSVGRALDLVPVHHIPVCHRPQGMAATVPLHLSLEQAPNTSSSCQSVQHTRRAATSSHLHSSRRQLRTNAGPGPGPHLERKQVLVLHAEPPHRICQPE